MSLSLEGHPLDELIGAANRDVPAVGYYEPKVEDG
jgi:hypothetical protein